MRRLPLFLGAAALALGLAGCPVMHGSYPSSGAACTADADCFCGEVCGGDGRCAADTRDGGGCAIDAGVFDAPDGGNRG